MKENKIFTLIGFGCYFFRGFTAVMFAPALPEIIKGFSLSITSASLIFPAMAMGGLIAVLAGGYLSDQIGRKPLVMWGLALLGLGYLGIGFFSVWMLVLLGFFISNIGGGFLNVSINSLIANANPDSRASALNKLHGIYGIGGLVGPLVTGSFIYNSWGWEPLFCFVGGVWLLFILAFFFIPAEKIEKKATETDNELQKVPLLKWGRILMVCLFLIAFLYNGTAWALIGWINTYLQSESEHVFEILSAGLLSLFYLALSTGRFFWSYFSEKIEYGKVILLCALGATFFYPWTIWSSSPWLIAIGVMGTGLFLSGLYPTALAYATSIRPNLAGIITGSMATGMILGKMIVPWLVGVLAEKYTFKTSLGFNYILIAALIGVAWSILKSYPRFISTTKSI